MVEAAMSADQTEALSDDSVTADEYQAGFRRFRSCLLDAGFDLGSIDDTRVVIYYTVPDEAVQSGADATCYSREFQNLDMAWQLAHEDTSESTAILRKCLIEHGITPAETTTEMGQQARDGNVDLAECTK